MICVLEMDLEPVRVVLTNEVNRILVCEDRRRAAGAMYTVIAVTSPQARRLAARLTAAGAFAGNADFVGSATQGDALHLVFRYKPESLLTSRESLYATDFVHRRTMAASFLAACAETQLPPDLAILLVGGRCVNLSPAGDVYFNYYFDLADYRPGVSQKDFCRTAAAYVMDLLSRDYLLAAQGGEPDLPAELLAFQKKAQVGGFASMGALLAAVRALPDHPHPPQHGLRRLLDRLLALVRWVRSHALSIFMTLLILITAVYAAWQISLRIAAGNSAQANTVYGGLQTIGDVSLTDENE